MRAQSRRQIYDTEHLPATGGQCKQAGIQYISGCTATVYLHGILTHIIVAGYQTMTILHENLIQRMKNTISHTDIFQPLARSGIKQRLPNLKAGAVE
jgi:hypothetical protein